MRIDIRRLTEERDTVLEESWDARERDLNAAHLTYQGQVRVEARLRRESGIVKVGARFKGQRVLTCGRCTKDFSTTLDERFEFVFPADMSSPVLELDESLREELILAYPEKILCCDDCRGLCPRCGKNLNEGECGC
jgi:uncharacterized protein